MVVDGVHDLLDINCAAESIWKLTVVKACQKLKLFTAFQCSRAHA